MSVKVPRAPRAGEAPGASSRIASLRETVRSGRRRPARGLVDALVPLSCAIAGFGMLLLVMALLVELMPRSLLAQLLVTLVDGLVMGG